METHLIKIGNSKGLRIPAFLIRQLGLSGTLRLVTTAKGLLISTDKPRNDWGEQFKKAGSKVSSKEKEVLNLANKFDQEEWRW